MLCFAPPLPIAEALPSGRPQRQSSQRCHAFPLRPATLDDLHVLAHIEQTSRPGGNWSIQQVEEELRRERAVAIVAENENENDNGDGDDKNGAIAGWAVGWLVPPDELQVLEVAVAPACRGRGIGTSLVKGLVQEGGRKHGTSVSIVLLEVRESNQAAIRLYKTVGFQIVGRRKRFYADGEDALLMNLVLPPSSSAAEGAVK
jgi:[ribosomal protein S18]-alanine N-acetyltransferase